jgi:hypothetical protein
MMDVSVPSWVIPGTYAENLRFLQDKKVISSVELLFFLYDGEVRAQLHAELAAIKDFAGRFSYTVHLPDNLTAEHEELIELLAPLARFFVVHPPKKDGTGLEAHIDRWIARYGPRFLVENTRTDRFDAFQPLVPQAGICMDAGHLVLEGKNPAAFAGLWNGRIGELHLHGVDTQAALGDGRLPDHRRLTGKEAWFSELEPFLRSFTGTLNIEVFSWEEAEPTLQLLAQQGLIQQRSE